MSNDITVVQFKNGMYGVRKAVSYSTYSFEYATTGSVYWFHMPEHVAEYCQFKKKEDACDLVKKLLTGTEDDPGTPVSCDCATTWSSEPAVTSYKKPWYQFWSKQ